MRRAKYEDALPTLDSVVDLILVTHTNAFDRSRALYAQAAAGPEYEYPACLALA